jgi:hypothetical protein
MPVPLRRVLLAMIVAAVGCVGTPTARAADTFQFHLLVTGVAIGEAWDCPDAGGQPPAAGTECIIRFAFVAQEAAPNEGPRRAPWFLFAAESHVLFNPVGENELLGERVGFAEGVAASVDERLRSAHVDAGVPMSDGSTADVDLTWDMTGTLFNVAGTDGPIQEPGVPWGSQFHDRCFTGNWLAHQTWREGGRLRGSFGGVDVGSLFQPVPHFVGRGVFTVATVDHGACA